MKILVTGATGFAGSYLVDLLSQEGANEIYGTDSQVSKTSTNLAPDQQIKIRGVNLLNARAVNSLSKKVRPELVFHLAGIAQTQGEKSLIYQVNVGGTKHLLDSLARLKTKVQVILVSSGYVYGNCSSGPAKEEDELKPIGPYAQSKLEMEKLTQNLTSPYLKIIIVRPFNHTGPGQKLGFVVPDFAAQIAQIEVGLKPSLIMVGNLNVFRDFLDVRDVVKAYQLLSRTGSPGEIYNIASGKQYKISKLLEILLSLAKVKIRIVKDHQKTRPTDLPVLVGDNQKLKKLGWRPEIPIEETLKETLDYWREQYHKPNQDLLT